MWRWTGRPSSVSHLRTVRTPRFRYAAISFHDSRRSPGGPPTAAYLSGQTWPKRATAAAADDDARRRSRFPVRSHRARSVRPERRIVMSKYVSLLARLLVLIAACGV